MMVSSILNKMNSTLTKTFENCDIRLAEINGEVWWNLKDVCASLGMAMGTSRKLKERLNQRYFRTVTFCHQTMNRTMQMTAINQQGLLRIVWRSNKPKAEIFSDWCAEVVSEVLQTGRYDVREHEEQIQQLQQALERTEHQLAEERAEVDRRAFLVIKKAVQEWRMQNGHRYTDCTWRLKHYTQCLKRIKGLLYYHGNTPFVQADLLTNAHEAMKYFYGLCQRNPVGEQPHYTQTKLSDNFV